MSRIIVSYNYHPSEAFSGAVAIKVAEMLRAEGNKVFLHKIPFRGSNLHTALGLKHSFDADPEMHPAEHKRWKHMEALVDVIKPDFALDFHDTNTSSPYWKKDSLKKNDLADFAFISSPTRTWGTVPRISVEVRAAYKEMPKWVYDKVYPKMKRPEGRAYWYDEEYFYKVTDAAATKKLGLNVNSLAKGVTQAIQKVVAGKIRQAQLKTLHPEFDVKFKVRKKQRVLKSRTRK
ncbi:MAG: hypothetical protein WCW13_01050 [archaeon]|jgi:hypothetical protein